ncbi:MAG: APC family permease [Sphingomicrobium sp.]
MAKTGAPGSGSKLGFNEAWSMAVGGMIGGGIFATLGVVIALAGEYAWLSFVIGGLIALVTGHSYARLTVEEGRSGGAYRFLKTEGYVRAARGVAWLLIAGYILTVSVYAYTFGAYLGFAVGGPPWVPGAAAAAAIIILAGINLIGIHEAAIVEVIAVWGKLAVLLALAAFGLARWAPERLVLPGTDPGISGTVIGAATVFMAYEGFQLLTYGYDELKDREKLIGRAIEWAILSAIVVYVLVALGTPMLVGAATVVAKEDVALAEAGRAAFGTIGFVAVTIAAAFSTGSAINATLFATARLSRDVALAGDLPAAFAKQDAGGTPYLGVTIIAAVALVFALIGGLQHLVQAASFVFLGVFTIVNFLAWRRNHGWWTLVGAVSSAVAGLTLAAHLAGLI